MIQKFEKPPPPASKRLRLIKASVLALTIGLVVLVASVIWPTPLMIMAGMVVGLGLVIAAFVGYMLAIILDLRQHDVL